MRLCVLALLCASCGWLEPAPDRPSETLVVARGDTLSKLARAHGYTVLQLRAWNGIEGDLIEVGQQLTVYPGSRSDNPAFAGRPAPAKPAAPRGLEMPRARPCLAGPDSDGLGEAGMAASTGLTQAQAADALRAFVHHTLPCIEPDDEIPTAALVLELTVGCDGRVEAVEAPDRAGWPADTAACIAGTLRYTPFPAHGLPDGDLVLYPLRYTPP